MRKNVLKFMLLFLTLAFFMFTFNNVAKAEEESNEPTTEDVVDEPSVEEEAEEEVVPEKPVENEEPVVEEEVSARDMINDFLNKWLTVILATLGGAGGTGVALLIAKKILEAITKKISESAEANKQSKETLDEGQKLLVKAQEAMVLGLEAITEKIEDFEKKYATNFDQTMDKIINCIDEIDSLRTDNAKFKELVALLVTSNPQLASNGYATKILELLNEGSETHE